MNTDNAPEQLRAAIQILEKAAANRLLVSGIKGRLFLLHGDMDSNVLPGQTLQLADALIKANRDFDLLIVPNAGHGTLAPRSYALRRAWDFMVRHLLGAEPPREYEMKTQPGPRGGLPAVP